MQITQRDIQMLSLLFENKVASRQQIKELFFKNSSYSALSRRLSKLTINNFIIKNVRFHNDQILHYYTLTPFGLKTLLPAYQYVPIDKPIGTSSASPIHDMTLLDIKILLKDKKKLGEFFTENQLRYCQFFTDEPFIYYKDIRSDAVVKYLFENEIYYFAIEYESSITKSSADYKEKLRRYYQADKIPAVLFICKNEAKKKLLFSIDEQLGYKDTKVFICLLSEINKESFYFTNKNNQSILIK